MRISLVRHYRVIKKFPNHFLVRHPELVRWFEEYESAPVATPEWREPDTSWDICYCSPSERAILTARHIHDKALNIAPVLNELNTLHRLNKEIRLPFLLWGLKIRNTSLSDNPDTRDFKLKIKIFVNEVVQYEHQNILIVSHYFVMKYLQDELFELGFDGPKTHSPRNGQVYVYERP